MPFPRKVCVICSQEFELKPDKPGFANRCPECSLEENEHSSSGAKAETVDRRAASELNAARRKAIRDLLYRKDS
ncbi:hypothetical protein [Pseudacidobacterium ailaaui]|jgi:hypothetical protein|uniref:hypothetical protein n=1 Tax=Pseudacidobacterium ailaaui TaxID=1382359 RepID=UPI00047B1590|nr:hypothetical protein [Pseudacidobacterium ailaaui]MBX6361639.1 hypothetical protein [Pseudacidobacterium ailaaui]MCL6464813.1 hypothetical protein [Pseudacidobacterium ailaaui]MDI3256088.1 hypothetical protein [Bacillota bacterium]